MAQAYPTILVRFIAARVRGDFVSVSLDVVDGLADVSSDNSLVSWTLDGKNSFGTFNDEVMKALNKAGNALKVKFVRKQSYETDNGRIVKDPRFVFEGGVLLLGIQLSKQPLIKRPSRGYRKNTVSLRGDIVSVQVEPKGRPNGFKL